MKCFVSSILYFSLICSVSAGSPCGEASPLMTGTPAGCDGILMPKPWVEECVVIKEVSVPRCTGDLELCRTELSAVNNLFEERRVACEKTIAELESLSREAAGLNQSSLLDSFVPWMSLGLVGGFTLAYLIL